VQFWCVGADGYTYNNLVGQGANLELVRVCKGKKPTRNEGSILSLITWNGLQGRRFSYYCGGDGNVLLERDLTKNFSKSERVTVMKLDHHGASGEFDNGKILKKMKPSKVLLTPGHQYGHPCELLPLYYQAILVV
jgi:beta-lactamase superfamily II metal-dependent hydrolase